MKRNLATVAIVAMLCGALVIPVAHADRPSPVAYAAVAVPDLTCVRLDRAKDQLRTRGLRARVRGGGLFGIVVESNWVVVSQTPSGGSLPKGGVVTIYVDRDC